MRSIFFVLFLLSLKAADAQSFVYPKLPISGGAIERLVPSHWHTIDTIYGDLNGDKREDLVLVLEFNEAIYEARAYGDADTEIIKEFQRPRMLAVYFKNAKNQFNFALQHNHFILRAKEGGSFGDPYQGISIDKNTLNLTFVGGSGWRWQLDYQFKYVRNDWILIAATNRYYNNGSKALDERNYDFLSKKIQQTVGILGEEQANVTTSQELPLNQLKTFATFKKPWTWEITKDNFL